MPPFVQQTYSETIARAVAGMPASADYSADTRICESAAIGFGVAVSQGTSDEEALIGAATADDFAGVSIRDRTLVNSADDTYVQYDNMGVMTRGDIWVTVGGNVNAGENVTFNASTGVLSSAAASGTQFAVTGARWMTTAVSGGLAKLRLSGSLPGTA